MDPGDELVDVVDEGNEVVGSASRRELRARNLLHRCTYVFVLNPGGELYVHRRTDTKDVYPGFYDACAGGGNAAGGAPEGGGGPGGLPPRPRRSTSEPWRSARRSPERASRPTRSSTS